MRSSCCVLSARVILVVALVWANTLCSAELPPVPRIVFLENGTTSVLAPPQETGDFHQPDLVALEKIDPALKLDVRYATANNFAGRPVYPTPRVFLQRPAAEALARAHSRVQQQGYGMIIYDGYRPWSVTKIFWEITASDKKEFVADPAKGSRHNRGCAVDLTLCDLATSDPVVMPTDCDDFTSRSYATYPGGTPESRQNREILRAAMEAEGFKVLPEEWWHYDYKDWRRYPIMNLSFRELEQGTTRSSTTTGSTQ